MPDEDFDDEDDDLLSCDYCDDEYPEGELEINDSWELCPRCIENGIDDERMQELFEEMSDFVDRISKDHPLDD